MGGVRVVRIPRRRLRDGARTSRLGEGRRQRRNHRLRDRSGRVDAVEDARDGLSAFPLGRPVRPERPREVEDPERRRVRSRSRAVDHAQRHGRHQRQGGGADRAPSRDRRTDRIPRRLPTTRATCARGFLAPRSGRRRSPCSAARSCSPPRDGCCRRPSCPRRARVRANDSARPGSRTRTWWARGGDPAAPKAVAHTEFKGADPGYKGTAALAVEAALCLALPAERRRRRGAPEGGCRRPRRRWAARWSRG